MKNLLKLPDCNFLAKIIDRTTKKKSKGSEIIDNVLSNDKKAKSNLPNKSTNKEILNNDKGNLIT